MSSKRKEAIAYLRNIADNVEIPAYQRALRIALEDMERVEALEREAEKRNKAFELSLAVVEMRK